LFGSRSSRNKGHANIKGFTVVILTASPRPIQTLKPDFISVYCCTCSIF